jgi:hypothetical protein
MSQPWGNMGTGWDTHGEPPINMGLQVEVAGLGEELSAFILQKVRGTSYPD